MKIFNAKARRSAKHAKNGRNTQVPGIASPD